MTTTTNTTTLKQLNVNDVVLGIGTTVFTEPHTVTEVRKVNGNVIFVIATGGCLWPVAMVGANTTVTVAC